MIRYHICRYMYLFVDMVSLLKIPRNIKKKILALKSEFSKVSRYKIKNNCLYACNEHMDTKIKNTIPFIIAHKSEIFTFKSNNVQYSYAKTTKC